MRFGSAALRSPPLSAPALRSAWADTAATVALLAMDLGAEVLVASTNILSALAGQPVSGVSGTFSPRGLLTT